MIRWRFGVSTLAVLGLSGCGPRLGKAELIGEWSTDKNGWVDLLFGG